VAIIDAHQHYWQLSRFDYGWIDPADPVLHRDYLPDDAAPEMSAAGVGQAVLVQALGSVDETRWLLELADRHPRIAGVVGWIDLSEPNAPATLRSLSRHPRFRGVRPGLTGSPDALRPGLNALADLGLCCDVLGAGPLLPQVAELARRHPGITFVLNHVAGARVAQDGLPAWRAQAQPLADLPNVAIKLSGFLTAGPRPPTANELASLVEAAIGLFGPARLMFGSDWPVCLRGGRYGDAVGLARQAIAGLPSDQQSQIMGGAAARAYHIA
jgi:L-fuconolactonase